MKLIDSIKINDITNAWFIKWRYSILCFLLFLLMCFHTKNGLWVGDFWEHSAVVRELATHILQPKHPQLLLDSPHAFYSPYTLMAAFLVRILHSDAINILSIMGIINLSLLFFGIKMFTASIVPIAHRSATAFYALLLTLFWWGSHPWGYSGFFHIGVLGYVLPYPSTFAGALTLITLWLNWYRIQSSRNIWCIVILLFSVVIFISHPITFIFLVVGLLSQLLYIKKKTALFQIILIGCLLLFILFISFFWPYFPVLKLLISEGDVYHSYNESMYKDTIVKIWPSLMGYPLLFIRTKSREHRQLLLMIVIFLLIYIVGVISGKYSYGRIVSYIILLLHVKIAEYLSKIEFYFNKSSTNIRFKEIIISVVVIFFCIILSVQSLGMLFVRVFLSHESTYNSYSFLSKFTNQYDVVLSDIDISWIIPTFGGKIVAAQHPLAFVPDHNVRKLDVVSFFERKTSQDERQRIIDKYNVTYLLLKKYDWLYLQRSFMSQGKVEFQNNTFILIRLNANISKDLLHKS